MEQRTMTLLMAPKPAVLQKIRQAKAIAEKARQQALKEGRAAPPEPQKEEEDLEKLEQQLEEEDEDEDEDEGEGQA
jgi:translation initiation factor IF-3